MSEEPAPRLSIAEYMTAARFDKAPAAPESFDATAAVRRVMALAEELEQFHTERDEHYTPEVEAREVAARIRRAVEGEQ